GTNHGENAKGGGESVVAARVAAARAEHAEVARRAERAGVAVYAELVARVLDVEVAHRELADAVERAEHRLAALHRQALGVVREVRAGGVDHGVVVAPPQPQRDLAGDRRA